MIRFAFVLGLLLSFCSIAQAQERLPPIPGREDERDAEGRSRRVRGDQRASHRTVARASSKPGTHQPRADRQRLRAVQQRLAAQAVGVHHSHRGPPLVAAVRLAPALAARAQGRAQSGNRQGHCGRPPSPGDGGRRSGCLRFLHRAAAQASVSDATYARALSIFGERGIVDMIVLTGHYTTMSMVLNTARTGLPSGATPALAPFRW